MGTRMNRSAYAQEIKADLAWLSRLPQSPERNHIESVLRNSIESLYGPEGLERGQLVWVGSPRYHGPGIFQEYVRNDGVPQRGPVWQCAVLLENGNTWWYPISHVVGFPHVRDGKRLDEAGVCDLCKKGPDVEHCKPVAGHRVLKDEPLNAWAKTLAMANLRKMVIGAE